MSQIDTLVIILIVVAIALFFVSRTVLKRTSSKVAHYERLQEMYRRTHELHDKGMSEQEIMSQLQKEFALNSQEVEFLLKKTIR